MAIAASFCNSETVAINISGAIVDSSGKAVAGAEIRLERAKISTKSDENGVFTLTGSVTVGIKSEKVINGPGMRALYYSKYKTDFCGCRPIGY